MALWKQIMLPTAYGVTLYFVVALITYNSSPMCYRNICVSKARLMLTRLDTGVSPCDNFLSFVSKDYKNVTFNTFSTIENNINQFKERLYNGEITYKGRVAMVSSFYQRCIKNINKDLPLLQTRTYLTNAILSTMTFPNLYNETLWSTYSFNIGEYELMSKTVGFTSESLFKCYIGHKLKKESGSIIIEPPSMFTISQQAIFLLYTNSEYRSKEMIAYVEYIQYLFNISFGMPVNSTTAQHVIEFEFKVIKLMNEVNKKAEEDLNMSFTKFQKMISFVNWKDYLLSIPPNGLPMPKTVVLHKISYFHLLQDIIKSTPNHTIAMFMVYRNLLEMDRFVYTDLSVYVKTYFRVTFSVYPNGHIDETRYCQDLVEKYFPGIISHLVIKEFRIRYSGKEVIEKMFKNIKLELKDSITKSYWMDFKTKKKALLKLKYLKQSLSVSDKHFEELKNKDALETYYGTLCHKKMLIEEIFCANKFIWIKNMELYNQRETSAFDVANDVLKPKIQYIQGENKLVIPTAVLQYPVFDIYFPMSLNYGSIGSVIAYELSHGFDDLGAKYDENAVFNNWWSDNTLQTFYKKETQCNENEKNFLSIRPNNVKASYNISHFIKEVGGLKLSYGAYLRYVKSLFLKDMLLYAFEDYDPKKMFFIAHANIYNVSNERPLNSEQSKSRYQSIIEAMTSLKVFKSAFECKNKQKNDRTYIDNCTLW